jgi:hypothetical protein
MKYAIEMAAYAMTHIPSFMKIGKGIQDKLRILKKIRGCNADITDERDLLITPLRWDQVT